jgi:hypothetical protein
MATDLWPNFTVNQLARGIKQVLEDAGRGLKEKTHGVVEFRVTPAIGGDPLYPFRYRCDLHVPKLSYSFILVLVESAPDGFPVVVKSDPNVDIRVEDESGLIGKLKEIFNSPRTTGIIQNLITMAAD